MEPLVFVPFEKRSFYPHMKPADVAIWNRFIDANPSAFEEVCYDVPVGSGPDFDTVVNQETGGNVLKLYKKKIDVLAKAAGSLFVIEVKPQAGTSSIGQVKGYVTLYKRDYKPSELVKPVIVTDEQKRDMEFLAKEEGVMLLIA